MRKFNNDLLSEPDYVHHVKTLVRNVKTDVMENKNTYWNYLKCQDLKQ